ncbi:hypothetical protein GOP47_0002976 [Adiantum capillus-veneris]|uniref:Auxin-responsive protein n=1 Tax=Adiantum capillus-veneris TaxID=13818 RepID=A0A9D4VBK1_ADICA|nr:hypothetical protein GOP47_0002976 [Adiantum capillus-veneris]
MQARPEENGKHCFLLNMAPPHLRSTGSLMPTNCSSEASTSSTVISPSSHDVSEAPCESSAQSNSSLKEHDYIGMADISSMSEPEQLMHQVKLDSLEEEDEPDLRLGLGPSPLKGVCDRRGLLLFPRPSRENFKQAPCISDVRIEAAESTHVAHAHPHSSTTVSMPSLKRVDAIATPSSFYPLANDPHCKSTKRLFSDIISQVVGSAAYVNAETGVENHVQKPGAIFSSGAARMIMQRPAINIKPLARESDMMSWGTRASSWHSEATQNMIYPIRKVGEVPLTMKGILERQLPSGGVIPNNLESGPDEAPPAKEQVIGWPPVRSYRRSAINSGRSRPAGTEPDVQAAAYVKVNMDGIPIGRKVDLTAYNNYDELLSALEGMFYSPPIGEGVCFLHARDFVLTYEDKEGDWMLVGDVPWGMFVDTVKRLRITRGLDSACLGPSTSKNFA